MPVGLWISSTTSNVRQKIREVLSPAVEDKGFSYVELGAGDTAETANSLTQLLILQTECTLASTKLLDRSAFAQSRAGMRLCLILSETPLPVEAIVALGSRYRVKLFATTCRVLKWMQHHPSATPLRHLPKTFLPLCGELDDRSPPAPGSTAAIGTYLYPGVTVPHRDLGLLAAKARRAGIAWKADHVTCWHSAQALLRQIRVFVFYPEWDTADDWQPEIAEAMLAGCAVVAPFRSSSSAQLQVQHGLTGYRCRSTEEYLDILSYLVDNPEEINSIGARAAQTAKQWAPAAAADLILEGNDTYYGN